MKICRRIGTDFGTIQVNMCNKGRVIKLPSGSDSQAALATQLMSVSCFAHLTVNSVNGTRWTLEISDLFGMHNAGFQQLFSCLALSTTLYYSQLPRKVPASACLHEEDDCSAGTTELMVSLTVLPSQHRRAGCISPYSQSCPWTLSHVLSVIIFLWGEKCEIFCGGCVVQRFWMMI